MDLMASMVPPLLLLLLLSLLPYSAGIVAQCSACEAVAAEIQTRLDGGALPTSPNPTRPCLQQRAAAC